MSYIRVFFMKNQPPLGDMPVDNRLTPVKIAIFLFPNRPFYLACIANPSGGWNNLEGIGGSSV
jgi:hypothetical protein